MIMKRIVIIILCLFCLQSNIIYASEQKNVFQIKKIDDELYKKINGVSWSEAAPVKIDDLRLVTVVYYGFDDMEHQGEFIVHKNAANDVVGIFRILLENKFPIDKINLIDNYGADDNASMADNNSSAYNFRKIAGSKKLSMHSYGAAIDINPIQNPWVKGNSIFPKIGAEYANREYVRKGMIIKYDVCYDAFKKYGWSWGGDWTSSKDYQHFEKQLDSVLEVVETAENMIQPVLNAERKIYLN